jgi:hypothetical protein
MSCRGYIFSFVTPAEAGVQGNQDALATLDPSPDSIRGSRRDHGQKTDANPGDTPLVVAALPWHSP